MNPIFADASAPDPAAISSWLSVAFYLLGGIAAAVGALVGWRALNPAPTALKQPVIVQGADKFPTEAECEARHERLAQEFGRERIARKGIYERIEAQGVEIASLTKEVEMQTISLDELKATHLADLKAQIERTNERIDAVPARVISLLRETKGLIP